MAFPWTLIQQAMMDSRRMFFEVFIEEKKSFTVSPPPAQGHLWEVVQELESKFHEWGRK